MLYYLLFMSNSSSNWSFFLSFLSTHLYVLLLFLLLSTLSLVSCCISLVACYILISITFIFTIKNCFSCNIVLRPSSGKTITQPGRHGTPHYSVINVHTLTILISVLNILNVLLAAILISDTASYISYKHTPPLYHPRRHKKSNAY